MAQSGIKKLYYSISEVAKLANLEPYVLRYWETEFDELRPQKNKAGNRIYKVKDIRLILKIKELLYEDKYTIAGACQQLKNSKDDHTDQMGFDFKDARMKDVLLDVKRGLKEVLELL